MPSPSCFTLAVAAVSAAVASHAAAASLPLVWRDVAKIGVHCLVQNKATPADQRIEAALCEQVRRSVAKDAPAPVTVFGPVEPAMLAPDTATLLVHANLQPISNGRLVVFTMRPFRNSAEQTTTLFGAPPRAALVPAGAVGSPALTAALDAALGETLPWRAAPNEARPIR